MNCLLACLLSFVGLVAPLLVRCAFVCLLVGWLAWPSSCLFCSAVSSYLLPCWPLRCCGRVCLVAFGFACLAARDPDNLIGVSASCWTLTRPWVLYVSCLRLGALPPNQRQHQQMQAESIVNLWCISGTLHHANAFCNMGHQSEITSAVAPKLGGSIDGRTDGHLSMVVTVS